MEGLYENIAGLDKVLSEPSRLAILVVLYEVEECDFMFLQRMTGLTRGNLSFHIYKLEKAGYIKITKKFINKKPTTVCRITKKGKKALLNYLREMKKLIDNLNV